MRLSTPGEPTPRLFIARGYVVDGSRPRSAITSTELPEGVRVVEFHGPLFFGASSRLDIALKTLGHWPRVLIIRMREVPLVDATGVDTLEQLAQVAGHQGCRIIGIYRSYGRSSYGSPDWFQDVASKASDDALKGALSKSAGANEWVLQLAGANLAYEAGYMSAMTSPLRTTRSLHFHRNCGRRYFCGAT